MKRRSSTILSQRNFTRYGEVWATAPETAGKTTHELTAQDIEGVRERRRAEGCAESTWNKEIGWLRTFYVDLLDAIREHRTATCHWCRRFAPRSTSTPRTTAAIAT